MGKELEEEFFLEKVKYMFYMKLEEKLEKELKAYFYTKVLPNLIKEVKNEVLFEATNFGGEIKLTYKLKEK